MQITIDNQIVQVRKGMTILETAKENSITIPTLCDHKDLPPLGGCRMCIVEVEGMRVNPTACTTPVTENMVVRTDTTALKIARQEILQLILAKHPSGCLLCDQEVNCRDCMDTIRKVGITTGCRTCPKDGMCELQDIVERLGLKELKYPVTYHGYRVEKFDPFYDRDYNLCILCGRCVQVCQELRLAETLAFIQRGYRMTIGPAFGRTHLESRCEFCGSCVSVCPTGTLSEKVRKWDGKPDKEVMTTCPFCGLGCQIRLQVKDDEVIGALGDESSFVSDFQLCVKGRFGVPELVNNTLRLKNPCHYLKGTQYQLNYQEAIDLISKKLADCFSDEFQMYVSPDCTNEDLYVAQKFCRIVMGSNRIGTSAEDFYGKSFNNYLRLFEHSKNLSSIHDSDVVFSIGLDPRFTRSVIGVEIRKAAKKGARIISLHPNEHHLSMIATNWLSNVPGKEGEVLKAINALVSGEKYSSKSIRRVLPDNGAEEFKEIVNALKFATSPAILVGTEFLQFDSSAEILSSIEKLATEIKAALFPLTAFSNLLGTYYMGAMAELLPGGYSYDNGFVKENVEKLWQASIPEKHINRKTGLNGKTKVLYLIGELPKENMKADFIIYQNSTIPQNNASGEYVYLPAAEFTEVEGSFVNIEGRVQKVQEAVLPPEEAKPHWKSLCNIAQKVGFNGLNYKSSMDIDKEIGSLVEGFAVKKNHKSTQLKFNQESISTFNQKRKRKPTAYANQLILKMIAIEDIYHGSPHSTWVDGMKEIFPEGIIIIHPHDAEQEGIYTGDSVELVSDSISLQFPVQLSNSQQKGTINLSVPAEKILHPNPMMVKIRKR